MAGRARARVATRLASSTATRVGSARAPTSKTCPREHHDGTHCGHDDQCPLAFQPHCRGSPGPSVGRPGDHLPGPRASWSTRPPGLRTRRGPRGHAPPPRQGASSATRSPGSRARFGGGLGLGAAAQRASPPRPRSCGATGSSGRPPLDEPGHSRSRRGPRPGPKWAPTGPGPPPARAASPGRSTRGGTGRGRPQRGPPCSVARGSAAPGARPRLVHRARAAADPARSARIRGARRRGAARPAPPPRAGLERADGPRPESSGVSRPPARPAPRPPSRLRCLGFLVDVEHVCRRHNRVPADLASAGTTPPGRDLSDTYPAETQEVGQALPSRGVAHAHAVARRVLRSARDHGRRGASEERDEGGCRAGSVSVHLRPARAAGRAEPGQKRCLSGSRRST